MLTEVKALNYMSEADVVTTDNLDGYIGKIGRGWFVYCGYINEVKLSSSSRYVNADNLGKLRGMSGNLGPVGKKFMGTTVDDAQAWLDDQNPKKRKTVDFHFSEDVSMIEYVEYEMHWFDNKKVAEIEKNKFDRMLDLRKKHGFDGSEEANNSWRGKTSIIGSGPRKGETKYVYGGGGLMPNYDNRGKGTNYTAPDDTTEINMWVDPITGKRAYRQDPKALRRKYIMIDNSTGEVEDMDAELYSLLKDQFGRPKVEQAKAELEAEEQAFVDDMKALEKEFRSALSLLEDKTLWMSYTIQMPDGSTRPSKTWKNPALESKYENVINHLGLGKKLMTKTGMNEMYQDNIAPVLNLQERLMKI